MPYCLSCFEYLHVPGFRRVFERKPFLCEDCLSKLRTQISLRRKYDSRVLFLSAYDGIMKSWLMQFKEYGDIVLAPCFLFAYLPLIRLYSMGGYVFVPCPSSEERVRGRGFQHLVEMLKAYDLPVLDVLEKCSGIEQKNTKAVDRGLGTAIRLKANCPSLKGRKLVLFDDVLTSGTTYQASLSALRSGEARAIRGLILMDNDKTCVKLS